MDKRFSIIIVNTNEGAVLFDCLDAVKEAGGFYETIVFDHNSTDGSADRVEREYQWVILIKSQQNLGYAGGNNAASKLATGEILVFLNPDAFPDHGWLESIEQVFSDESVGVASPRIYRGRLRASNVLDSAGADIEFPLGDAPARGYLALDHGQFPVNEEVAYAAGAAMAVRSDLFKQLGGFDEYFFCYCEETDFCWRARMVGYKCMYVCASTVYHIGSFSFGTISPRKLYFQQRNRIIMSLQNLESKNLPTFIFSEVVNGALVMSMAPFFAKYRGLGKAYFQAWKDVIIHLPRIAEKRELCQSRRSINDDFILRLHRKVLLKDVFLRYCRMVWRRSDSLFNARPLDVP